MSGDNLALKIGSFVLGVGVFLLLYKIANGVKKYGSGTVIYVIAFSLSLSLSVFWLFVPLQSEILLLFLAQLFIVSFGIVHVVMADKMLPWHNTQIFQIQLVFIVCILVFAYLLSNLSFTYFVSSQVKVVWHLSLLIFLVPILLNQTVNKLLEVPPKLFKKWQYPVNTPIEDPYDSEMQNPVVISFVFKKEKVSNSTATFRVKAPMGMTLGRLFYFFINDYNNKHPNTGISYLGENNEPDEWVFYKVKNKTIRSKEALDPDNSIFDSNIKENDVLLCKRINIT